MVRVVNIDSIHNCEFIKHNSADDDDEDVADDGERH